MVSAPLSRQRPRPPPRGRPSRAWTTRWAFALLTLLGLVGLSFLCTVLPEDLARPRFLHWEGPSISSFSPIIDTSLIDDDEDLVVEFEKNVPFPMRADKAIGRKPTERKAQKHSHVEASLAPPRPPPQADLAVASAKPHDAKGAPNSAGSGRRVEVGVSHGQEGNSHVASALTKGTRRLFKDKDKKEKEEEKEGQGNGVPKPPKGETCRAFLESSDRLAYSRDFHDKPILVHQRPEEGLRSECDVGCDFRSESATSPFKSDATFEEPRKGMSVPMPPSVHLNMESSVNYPMSNVSAARTLGFGVVMTTSLDSDVPVTYGAWTSTVPFRPAFPVANKNNSIVVLISNCAAVNFRNDAVTMFKNAGLEIRSYGECMHNMPDPPKSKIKEEIVPPNKFTLAFENSNEDDYVTEKFFDALEYGAVPIVIGAPNIAQHAPSSNSYLAIQSKEDVPRVIERVKHLMSHDDEYEEMLAWKKKGASDSFLALLDLANVHSACRLCIHLADKIRAKEDEQRREVIQQRPCSCQERSGGPVVHHLYVREKGTFYPRSLFLKEPLTLAGLHKAILEEFSSGQFKPIWTHHRPSYRKRDARGAWDKKHFELRIHRIFPKGVTYRAALYGESGDLFLPTGNDKAFEEWMVAHPCAELEVIFV